MPSSSYTPTTWVNDAAPPVSASNLNKIEGGIEDAHERIDTLEGAGSGDGTPPGVVAAYAGASPPSGWLLCDGAAVSRSTYAALFSAISTNYGAGDTTTTFNVPDLRGRMAVGKGTHTSVSQLNSQDPAALANRSPKHWHDSGAALFFQDTAVSGTQPGTGESGGNNGMRQVKVGDTTFGNEDTPSYLVLNYIIKT